MYYKCWSLIVVVGWGVEEEEEEEAGKREWKEIAFQIRKQLVTSKLHFMNCHKIALKASHV